MRKRIRDNKEVGVSNGMHCHHTHPGRVWGILHVIKYHHWRHVKRRITPRRCNGGSHNASTSNDSDDMADPNSALSNLTPPESVHNLEVDPLSEMLLTVENPEPVIETFQNHLASGTLDVLSPVFSGSNKSINSNNTNSDKCVECGALFSSEPLENHDDKIHHKHHNISISEGLPEDKLMNAKIFTTDASPHLFKDFLDALEVINTNKDFLMKYINDPGSPLPFEIHTQQQSPNFKPRRAKSISLPVYGSSSGTKDSEHTVSELIDTKGKIQSEIQNVGDLHKPSTSSSSSHKVDEVLNSDQESVERENKNISSDSSHSQVQNQVKPRNFMDLRKKIKHIIEESKSEKRRITMDAIVDKIPGGNRFSENVRKLINHSQSKGHNREGKENGTTSGYYGNRLSKSYSRNKSQLSSMRTSSLKESADRYSQLYDTCFQQETANNNEVKNPKTESLKLKTEEKSSILKTPKSFQRFLSLPNLKSQHNQSEESSLQSSPQNSIRKTEDRTINKNDDFSKSQILSPTLSDHTNEESILNDEQKQDHVKSAPESESEAEAGLDVNDKIKSNKSIVIDGLGTLKGSESAASIGSTMLVEANSTFSSEASFLDCTFELENLNGLEDQELKPVAADDELNNIFEQQDAKDENFLKFGYEIPRMEIDTNNEAAYNYVKKVLELSGFTSNESLGTWWTLQSSSSI
ncbi:hypothetical protein TSUD_19410 [Trifolium subterraneum]|uniref:DUF3741 domain-containing protein n=1 Tax=Trifolium subterraneum TaxID=3900 RepID=A0A2Z6MU11_TRISU|nr:hypothetical protein TSUD_19410 [Trifolium subterraneum]